MDEQRIKSIEEYAQNSNPLEFYQYLRFVQPEAIADIQKAEKYLIQDFSNSAKILQILQAYEVKMDLRNNRPRDGSEPPKPYAVYQALYPKGNMSMNQFYEVFNIVDSIELAGEIECSVDSVNAVSQWLAFGETNDSIIHFLKLYILFYKKHILIG